MKRVTDPLSYLTELGRFLLYVGAVMVGAAIWACLWYGIQELIDS